MSHAQDKDAEEPCPYCREDWTHHTFVPIASEGDWPFQCGRDPVKDGIDPVLKFFHDDQVAVIEAEKAKMAATIAEKVAEAKRERLSGLRKGIEEELRGETDARIALLNGQHAAALGEKDRLLSESAERETAFAARVQDLNGQIETAHAELKTANEELAGAEREALEFKAQRDRAIEAFNELGASAVRIMEELKASLKPSDAAPADVATPKAAEAPTAPAAPPPPPPTTPADQTPPETEADEKLVCDFKGCVGEVTHHCEIELNDGSVYDLCTCAAGCNPRGTHISYFIKALTGKTKVPIVDPSGALTPERYLASLLEPISPVEGTDDEDDDVDDGADDNDDEEEET